MARFCPNCGKQITDDITQVCSNCGFNLAAAIAAQPAQKTYAPGREDLFARAVPFFTSRDYSLQTQTDYIVTFQSQSRDVNWLFFVILCCLGIIPGAVYYYWFTSQHMVTISLSGAPETKVTVTGNTDKAKRDASDFMQLLI